MEKYNYFEQVCADVREWINENAEGVKVTAENRDELAEQWHDEMWTADSVTGNGSGSYTFSTWQAEENLCHNLDLLGEAMEEFGYGGSSMSEIMESAETADVTIRCYLLPQAISQVLDELETDEDEDEDEE